jgi:hypothetical protein
VCFMLQFFKASVQTSSIYAPALRPLKHVHDNSSLTCSLTMLQAGSTQTSSRR